MAKRVTFTVKYLDSLKPKDKPYRVVEARGFCVRVLPSGTKSFGYRFTLGGKKQELSLGVYTGDKDNLANAHEKYRAAYTKLQNGIDPRYIEPAPAAPEDNTFKHFSDLYLAWSEQHHSKELFNINKYSLNNDVLPFWKDLPLLEIRKRDAIALLQRVALRSRGQVSNVQRAARGVFQHAIELDYIENNPLLRLQKIVPALKYQPKDRVLTDVEIRTVWPLLPPYLKLILLTAQRPGEIAGMHSKEIAGDWWTIPKERAKKGKGDHLVYLTDTVLELIGNAEGYVFPSPNLDQPIQRMALSRFVNRNGYFNLPLWTPHDLRRTARTHMARIGILDEHAEAVIAHCKQGMKKVYNKYEYQAEKKQALIKWEAELLRIVS